MDCTCTPLKHLRSGAIDLMYSVIHNIVCRRKWAYDKVAQHNHNDDSIGVQHINKPKFLSGSPEHILLGSYGKGVVLRPAISGQLIKPYEVAVLDICLGVSSTYHVRSKKTV